MKLNNLLYNFLNKSSRKNHKEKKIEQKYKKLYNETIKIKLEKINENLKKDEISFLHSGHLGDIINSLPLIKEISKNKKCKLFIETYKLLPLNLQNNENEFGKYYLNEFSVKKLLPLLSNQPFIKSVDIYNNEKIDVDLNLFREMPINFNIDSVRWYFHLTGIHGDLEKPYLTNINMHTKKDKIVIIRSNRRRNYLINYNFLNKHKDILFLGLKNEYLDLKKEIPNMEFFDCENFLEMAEIINSCKLFIGNLSFGYTIAEALKKPRLLESGPGFPLVYPNGINAYDFYFQEHFENNFKKLYTL